MVQSATQLPDRSSFSNCSKHTDSPLVQKLTNSVAFCKGRAFRVSACTSQPFGSYLLDSKDARSSLRPLPGCIATFYEFSQSYNGRYGSRSWLCDSEAFC